MDGNEQRSVEKRTINECVTFKMLLLDRLSLTASGGIHLYYVSVTMSELILIIAERQKSCGEEKPKISAALEFFSTRHTSEP